ncbi:hypothetical protein FKM82_011220 [Ascaphus truei]
MDEEDTRGYKEPCPQCSQVNWGITDESKFYCKSCHTVIERTKEVAESETFSANAKIQSISRGLKRKKQNEKGWDWYICEGFQFILLKQAEALQALGIDPKVKDEIMCNFWRRYLQKSKQAYVRRPAYERRGSRTVSESSATLSEQDTELETFSIGAPSLSEAEGDSRSDSSVGRSSGGGNTTMSESAMSAQSGSLDGALFMKPKKRGEVLMSMPMTLAFCYLSLLWMRESITLSDLLRLVVHGHIPYMNAEQYFPEQTKLYGIDIRIFRVQSFPVYGDIMNKTSELGAFMDLPRFPPITESCFLHPNILCMKYLMEANLPDELHNWACRVVKKTGLGDTTAQTFDPLRKTSNIVQYEVQAAALITVVLKLLFLLDDKTEWVLSSLADKRNRKNTENTWFDFEKWYKTMKLCIDEAQQKMDEEHARYMWNSEKAMYYSEKVKAVAVKKKQMAVNLQRQFSKLAGAVPKAGKQGPSSFLFNWEEQNTGRICFHEHSLEGIMQQESKLLSALNTEYWLSSLKKCRDRFCKHWTLYEESNFPRSYHFVLTLFSFLLRVEVSVIHYEVCLIEQRLFKKNFSKKVKWKSRR